MSRRDGRPWWDKGSTGMAWFGIALGALFVLCGSAGLALTHDGLNFALGIGQIMLGLLWVGIGLATRRARLREQVIGE